MTPRPHGTALVVHADLASGGGAELYGARVLALLAQRFDRVVLVHAGPPVAPEDLARLYGVRMPEGVLSVVAAGRLGRAAGAASRRLQLLKYAAALRAARPLAPGCDLLVSTYGECPLAAPRVLQCVHVPLFLDDAASLGYLGAQGGSAALLPRRAYVRLARRLAGWDPSVIRRHPTVTNSRWTAGVMNRAYGMDHAACVYPGAATDLVPGRAGFLPFAARSDGFVMVGRLVPSKRVEDAVAVVAGLRAGGRDAHLHVVGRAGGRYGRALRRRLGKVPFVHLHEGLPRPEMEALIARHRYGLHAYRHEHFGSAPAELQRLGCLVFVHDSGGQREVIASPEQRYADVPDAVGRITGVMDDPALARRLLARAARVNDALTIGAFEKGFLEVVDRLMALGPAP